MTMRHFRNFPYWAVYVAILFITLSVPTTRTQAAGPPPGLDVNVVNTPLPVLQPFQHDSVITTPAGLLGGNDTFTVPAGKRLVIEFVSFRATWPAGQQTTLAFIGVCNSGGGVCPTNFFVPAIAQGPDFGGGALFTGSSPTRLYADAGTDVTVAIRRNATTGTGLASVAVSGYLCERALVLHALDRAAIMA
jgi:hypothetical protein